MGKKRRQRTCGEIARVRAQTARQRSRAAGRSYLEGEILFGVVLVSSLMAGLVMVPFPRRRQTSYEELSAIPGSRHEFEDSGDGRPLNQYESEAPGPIRRHGSGYGRYNSRPSFERLIKDLRRPAARCEAAAVLYQRIHDPETRAWVACRIHEDDINRLAVHVRPGVSEDAILEAWRAEVDADAEMAAFAASEQGVSDLKRIALALEFIGRDPSSRIQSNEPTKDSPRSRHT